MENHIESITGIKDEKCNEIRVYCENVFTLMKVKPGIRIKLEIEYLFFVGSKGHFIHAYKVNPKFGKVHRKVLVSI